MIWDLPESLTVGGRTWAIRTDYRDILRVLIAFDDPELTPTEKQYICMRIIYKDFDQMPRTDYPEAYKEAVKFIDNGEESDNSGGPRTVDWEQDAKIMFPAINTAAGYEVRSVPQLHWWTFMGYFMEIQKGVYATVLSLRQKKAKGKKLEKWEKEFWSANTDACVIRPKLTEEEKQEKEQLKALLG